MNKTYAKSSWQGPEVCSHANQNDENMYDTCNYKQFIKSVIKRVLKVLQSFGKFWKMGGCDSLQFWYLDAPVDVLKTPEILAPKTFLLSRKIEYKDLPVLPVNFDNFQIAPTAVQ